MAGMRGPASRVSPDEDAALNAAGAALMAVVTPITARRLPMDASMEGPDFAAATVCAAMQSVLATSEAEQVCSDPDVLAYVLGTLMLTSMRGVFSLSSAVHSFAAGITEAVEATQNAIQPQGGGAH